MGKTLEKLRRTPPHATSPVTTGAVTLPEPSQVVAVTPASEDDLTFIEVGGKDKPIEASADVLAHTGASARGVTAALAPVIKHGYATAAFATGPTLRLLAAVPPPAIEAPRGRVASWLVTHHDPNHPVSRQYFELLRGVRQTVRMKPDAHSLLFIASEHNIGATSALLNLAITAAREETSAIAQPGQPHGVLVVDGHFAEPGVARQLELPETPGLGEVLSGKLNWQQAVRPTVIPSLNVLPAGMLAAVDPTTSALAQTFQLLASQFEMIFVDGPCCREIDLALKFCVACDCIFPVVPNDTADKVLTHDLIQRFAVTGCHVAGAILTQN
jgi:Mrp family chromosome partitioning ATPase